MANHGQEYLAAIIVIIDMLSYKKFKELNESVVKFYSATISGGPGFTGISGKGNKDAVVFINSKGEFGFLEGKDTPYTPSGGRKVWDMVKDALQFKPYDWGDPSKGGYSVKRGAELK
jgi:hypothetical protein